MRLMELSVDTITFGKYKGSKLSSLLKDRQYCSYLLSQDWFKESYVYLYTKISEYNPIDFFVEETVSNDFYKSYKFFTLRPLEKILESGLKLTKSEKLCYSWYRDAVLSLKEQVAKGIRSEVSNPYNVKVPSKYLHKFELETGLGRDLLKEFLSSYDLKGITSIVEDLKSEAGINFKGAKGFTIAKERSLKQESFWSSVLKEHYKEYISEQFKFDNCKFDFINIRTNTIFEAKLGFKDFNEKQYLKYKLILERFKIIYLIDTTTIVDIQNKIIYTTSYGSVIEHQVNIPLNPKSTYLDDLIFDFEIEPVKSVKEGLEKISSEPK